MEKRVYNFEVEIHIFCPCTQYSFMPNKKIQLNFMPTVKKHVFLIVSSAPFRNINCMTS